MSQPTKTYRTTRADLIANGSLVPLPPALCSEAGYTLPVAITARVQEHIERHIRRRKMSKTRRENAIEWCYWDVLWMARACPRNARGEFSVHVGDDELTLIALISPEGQGEADVLTIMMHDED